MKTEKNEMPAKFFLDDRVCQMKVELDSSLLVLFWTQSLTSSSR